jgi:hypothetical protein
MIISNCVYAQQKTTPPPARKNATRPVATPDEVKSQWDTNWEGWGLTSDIYSANHLSRLGPEDILGLAIATWAKGYSDGRNSISPNCGPTGKNPDRSTVKLYIDMPKETDDEVASRLRARLRAFPDVRLVFTEADADATLGVLALKNMPRNSTQIFGYTLSYYASRPCAIGSGASALSFDLILSSDMQTAASVSELVEAVASTIDTQVSENVRKWNATAAKMEKNR